MKKLLLFLLTLFPIVVLAQGTGSTSGSSSISFTPAAGDLTFSILQSWYGVVDNVLAGTGSQLFGTLFGIFNSGVLTLAGIIVTYTLMVSTLNTAQEGEVLGKQFSSVWIPFRTVGGIALLIPKASGYSLIQIFMMWIAVQGIGLADTIWYATIDYFTGGNQGMISISAPGAFANSGSSPTPVGASTDILRSLTCLYMIQDEFAAQINKQKNYNLTHPTAPQPVNPTPPDLFGTVTAQFQKIQGSNGIGSGTIYIPGSLAKWPSPYSNFGDPGGACGTLSWNAVSLPSYMKDGNNNPLPQYTGLVSQINSQKFIALQTLVNSLATPAQQIANNAMLGPTQAVGIGQFNGGDATSWINGNTVNSGPGPLVQGGVIQNPAATYVGLLSTVMNQLSLSNSNTNANNALATKLKAGGWAMAGAAIFTLTQQSQSAASLNTAVLAMNTTAPSAATVSQGTPIYNFFQCSVDSSACNAINAVINGPSTPTLNSSNCGDYNLSVGPNCSFIKNSGAYSGQFAGAQQAFNNGADTNFSDQMAGASSKLGEINSGLSNLSAQQSAGVNPLVAAASLGSLLINVFMMMWLLGAYITAIITGALAVVPSVNLSNPVNTLLNWIMSFLSPFIMVLFSVGIVLAFYLPMIPYILFTFGVIGWFITVLEAMIAAPLVAIGITHPEGHAILGKADPAVLLIVNVFLRPTLMILGMLGGIFLSYAGVWLLNSGFSMAWSGATSQVSGISGIFTGIGGVVIYTIIAVQIVQKSFTLVYVIPDQVFKWIGGNIQGMGGEAEAEQKIAGGVQKGAEATGGLVKDKIAGDAQGKGGLSIGGGGAGSLDGEAGGKAPSGGGKETGKENQLQVGTEPGGGAGKGGGGGARSNIAKAAAAIAQKEGFMPTRQK